MRDSAMRKLRFSGALVFAAVSMSIAVLPVAAQTTKSASESAEIKTPVYDVVSIKPNKSENGGMSWRTNPDSFEAKNLTVLNFVMNAYGMRQDQIINAPGWAESTHFDISAKLVDPNLEEVKKLTGKQRRAMLQQILPDRFKFKAHIETRTLPVYELVIAKGGFKLTQDPPDKNFPDGVPRGSWTVGNGTLKATAMSMLALGDQLAGELEHTVIDKTGLPGVYDLTLKWTEETGGPAPEGSAPPLFTALQEQLGLKLQPSKGPVDVLIIDHIELPSDNEN